MRDLSKVRGLSFNHFYWHLELSSKCALKCPRCPRTEAPTKFKASELDLAFVRRILPPERLMKVERILLCGGEGDPIYCSEFLSIVGYLKSVRPDICLAIVTNGSYRPPSFWQELSDTLNGYDRITFSIDGWDQESNELYRVNSDWKSISQAVEIMGKSEAPVIWSTILFKFNQDRISEIRNLAKKMGADAHVTVKSTLFGSQVERYNDPESGRDPLEPSQDFLSSIGRHLKAEEILSDKPVLTNKFAQNYKTEFNLMYERTRGWNVLPLCGFGDRGLYVTAEKFLYPCSWVSHPYHGKKRSKLRKGTFTTWETSWFIKNRDEFNLDNKSVEEVLAHPLWMELIERWKDPEQTPIVCEQKCLRSKITPENLRFGL